ALAIGVDSRELRADVHVEADQLDVPQPGGNQRDVQRFIIWNAELVASAAGLDVLVRRIERDLRIHPDRYGRPQPAFARQRVDRPDLGLALGIDQQNAGPEGLGQLALRLADTTEDDITRREAGAQCA